MIRTQAREGLQKQRDVWTCRLRDKGWPKSLTAPPLNPTAKVLAAENLAAVQSIVDETNVELTPLASLAFDLLVEAEEAIWEQHRYEACPFLTLSGGGPQKRYAQLVIMEQWKTGVWTASYTVDSSDWPTLEAVLKEIDEIAAQRDRKIESYIVSL